MAAPVGRLLALAVVHNLYAMAPGSRLFRLLGALEEPCDQLETALLVRVVMYGISVAFGSGGN
eukprot:6210614-Pleurochrysis_carterae.AAC.1